MKVAAAVDEELRARSALCGGDVERCDRAGPSTPRTGRRPVEEHGGAARRVEARADVERRPAVGRRGLVGSGASFQELQADGGVVVLRGEVDRGLLRRAGAQQLGELRVARGVAGAAAADFEQRVDDLALPALARRV